MTTEETRALKRKLRKQFKEKRKQLDAAKKACLDSKITQNILSSISYKYADAVLMFYPANNEIDIKEVFSKAISDGKKVAFPKCLSKGVMKFFFAESEEDFEKGSYGISEPKDGCKEYNDDDFLHPLCIVPCLCVSPDGKRLGYGGGYYDRFLGSFKGISMSVQYEDCIFDEIPFEKRYDKKTHIIVSEKAVYVVGKK